MYGWRRGPETFAFISFALWTTEDYAHRGGIGKELLVKRLVVRLGDSIGC